MKLSGFPVPIKGELFRSVVTRHLARIAGPRSRHLSLLGLCNGSARSVIPTDLKTFCKAMPDGHPWASNPMELVMHHTMLPLFLSLSHPDRRQNLMEKIHKGQSKNTAASLGLTISEFCDSEKFCLDCINEDRQNYGYPVLYREHQPSFVKLCAKHAKPLYFSCITCSVSKSKIFEWRLAGKCECNQSNFPTSLSTETSRSDWENWLWLSKQVQIIFENLDKFHDANFALFLHYSLKENGYNLGSIFDVKSLSKALIHQFGKPFLNELGLKSWYFSQSDGGTLGRTLDARVIKGKSILNVIRGLLLLRLVNTDILEFLRSRPLPIQPTIQVPQGYGRKTSQRLPFSDEEISAAINSSRDRISVAAKLLGIGISPLSTELFKRKIRFPLPSVTRQRIGDDLIERIRTKLLTGVPKKEIENSLQISEWTRILIELDDHNLGDAHRDATIETQRNKHRSALQDFVDKNPEASRTDFVTTHCAAYDWLRRFDRVWLEDKLPPKRATQTIRSINSRKNWAQLDRESVLKIKQIRTDELAKTENLARVTPTRLLKESGILTQMTSGRGTKLPDSNALVQEYNESKNNYQQRKIYQALLKFNTPISVKSLRLAAKLDAQIVIAHRAFIVEVAHDLGLKIDRRSRLVGDMLHISKGQRSGQPLESPPTQ